MRVSLRVGHKQGDFSVINGETDRMLMSVRFDGSDDLKYIYIMSLQELVDKVSELSSNSGSMRAYFCASIGPHTGAVIECDGYDPHQLWADSKLKSEVNKNEANQ